MYYICIENELVVSILNYQPSVPATVSIVEISDEEYRLIETQTHYFNVSTMEITPIPESETEKKQQEKDNVEPREFLNSTDWMVLRHLRQRTLGVSTSLTEQQFLDLEQRRDQAATKIK
jgi:hypothetical protein